MMIRPILRALPWVAAVALSVGLTAAATPESGPAWASLTVAQQQALAPLQRDWGSIAVEPKQKWLEVAGRLPKMSAEERARVQERMAEWSRMTPAERVRARVQFQEVRRISPEERQTRWQQYQQLPDDERSQLAERARAEREAARAAATASRTASPDGPAPSKSSVVRTPSVTAGVGVATSLQQAKPGATTTTISTRPAPPAHHQAGLPKIVATPGFVDSATLLPKRGPQGAAVRAASAASAADPAAQP